MIFNILVLMFIAAIEIDPVLSKFVVLSTIIIVVGFGLRLLKQPSIIAYILVGIVMGPYGLGFVTDEALISNIGSLGLVLLLFFIGMEIHLPELIGNWRVSVFGTLVQVIITILVVFLVGEYFDWSIKQVILLGFVASLSSTAVIIKLLQERDELHTKGGQYVIGILLAQDVLIVPMLIVLGYLGGHKPEKIELFKQIIGSILIALVIYYLFKKKEVRLPFRAYIRKDHEMQVFVAFSMCFGFSLVTAFLGLSAALGAFVAGIFISASRETAWVHDSLMAFKVMFVALFFVSIGMLIDLEFLKENIVTIGVLVLLIFIVNNTINVIVMRLFCRNWKISVYAGALLSQVGEFSFILGSTGYYAGIMSDYTYQITISTIAISLFLSPFWITLIRKLAKFDANVAENIPQRKT